MTELLAAHVLLGLLALLVVGFVAYPYRGRRSPVPHTERLTDAVASVADRVDPGEAGGAQAWRLRLAPRPSLFRRGADPIPLLRELRDLGVRDLACDLSSLPDLAALEVKGRRGHGH